MSEALALFNEDLLSQARRVGGELDPETDRQVGTSEQLPIYGVVGRNSKDSSYRGVLDGKSVEVSRAGSFRRKNAEGIAEYFEELELVVIDARTAYTVFKDNKVIARGISTQGLNNAVWTDSDGCVAVGSSCESSPYCRWVWERQGGKEGRVVDVNGAILAKEDLAACALQLWCWSPSADEFCIVQFSAGAIRAYREFARGVEGQGVKIHSLLWRLATTPVDNGASAAPSYVPALAPVRVLTDQEFLKSDSQRAELVVKMMKLAANKAPALPSAQPRALPAHSMFNSPPLIDKGPAVADPNDVFATVD